MARLLSPTRHLRLVIACPSNLETPKCEGSTLHIEMYQSSPIAIASLLYCCWKASKHDLPSLHRNPYPKSPSGLPLL